MMAARKKTKKPKKGKQKDPAEDAPKQEVDAVKGFIFVMVLLTLLLAGFYIVKSGELDQVEQDLKSARANGPRLREMSQQIDAYLDLIENSEETVLLQNHMTFFKNIYASADVQAKEEDVRIGRKEDQRNSREGYTEYFWDIEIKNLERDEIARFMWWVDNRSPKAKAIEALVRRQEKEGAEDLWDGRFRIGYRVATTR